jgi:hypothetical protein
MGAAMSEGDHWNIRQDVWRSCSLSARGLWADLMALRSGGHGDLSPAELAQLSPLTKGETAQTRAVLLAELQRKGAFKLGSVFFVGGEP